MAWETRENSGSMFKNTRKERETHADMTGEINVNGTLYWLNGWRKIDKNGNAWLSLSVKEKVPRNDQAPVQNGNAKDILDDDIPF